VKRGTPEHPKTRALAEELKIPLPYAVGILEMVWHTTAKFTPQGNIGKWSDKSIAERVGWTKKADLLMRALVKTGWLEEDAEHRLLVHDWHDHADQTVERALAKKGLDFVTRARPKLVSIQHETDANRAETSSELAALALPEPKPLPEPLPSQAGPLPGPELEPSPEPLSSSDERNTARRSRGFAPAPRSTANGNSESPPDVKPPRIVSMGDENCTLEIAGELQTLPLADAEKLLAAKGGIS
jgi:hypothetical protein